MRLAANIVMFVLLLVFQIASCQSEQLCNRNCPPGQVCKQKSICFSGVEADNCFGFSSACVPGPPPPPPSCEDMNCPGGQVCVYQNVFCAIAPCHPIPTCIENGCDAVRCSIDTECKMMEVPGSDTHCSPFPECRYKVSCEPTSTLPALEQPPPSCAEVQCPDGQICAYQHVFCVVGPCHPIPTCIANRCTSDQCLSYTECRMVEIPGSDTHCSPFPECRYQASCVPNQALCNQRCPDGELCAHQHVFCVVAPCLPIRACIADRCGEVQCGLNTECQMVEIPGSYTHCRPFPECRYQASCALKPTLPPVEPPPPSCADIQCPNGQVCAYEHSVCVSAPCHPIPTCIANRCATVRCGFNTVCQMVEIPDSYTHCSPFPKCRYQASCVPRVKPKPGFCPHPSSVSQANVNLCTYDNDCPADLLCCPGASRGGLNCTAPAYPNPCSTIKCPPAPNIVGATCLVRAGQPSCADRVCQPGSFFCRDGKQCYCSDGGAIICTDVAAPPDCSS